MAGSLRLVGRVHTAGVDLGHRPGVTSLRPVAVPDDHGEGEVLAAELRDLNDQLMRFYDLHERNMSPEACKALSDIIGNPMTMCRECGRSMYQGFAMVLCWECTNH
jgi:hypothetical protein